MSAGKEIRSKIKSVQNTQKITKAMQMVATSKMRKTQEKMRSSRPYAKNIRRVVANLARINPYAKNSSPFLRAVEQTKNVAIILITSDKGLCGGLNSNVLKVFYEHIKKFHDNGIKVETCTLGNKGYAAVNRIGLNVLSSATGLGDIPQMDKIIGPLLPILSKFREGELDAVYIVYSRFVNTMKQQPSWEQLLPLQAQELSLEQKFPWDYLYEPSEAQVIDELIQRYVESVVFQCLADNMASEQASRMVAMKSATENAGNAIAELKLVYNKSRQSTITKELAEIVAGSAAV